MRSIPLLLCLATAICFALYPIFGRYSGSSTNWMRVVMSVATLVTILILQANGSYGQMPAGKQILYLVLAGTFAGAGAFFFGKLFAIETVQGLSISVPLISILTICLNGVLSSVIFREQITWKIGIGYILAGLAIWLIADKK